MFRIIDIAREISSGITPLRSNSEYWENGTIPWLKTEQIGEYRIKTTNEFVTEKALESTGLKLYPKNTISIAMYGEGKTRGNVSIIDCPMTTNQACCNIVVNESIVAPFYLYYFFKTQYHNLRQLSSGVRKNLNTNDIKNYLINLPNKITQQNIVNFLCSIDEKIELNNKINLELEKIAKTLYEYWFVQFDFPDENERPYKSSGGKMIYNEILKREIPNNWNNGALSDISYTQTGYAFKSCDWKEKGHPVLTIKVIENNSINISEASHIDSYQEKYAKYSVENGNIILAMTGNTIGKIGIIASDIKNILINQRVCIYKTNYSNIAYLYFNLLSEGIQNKIWQIGQNSSQPNISEEQLKILPIVLPPKELLDKYNKIFSSYFRKIVNNNIENQQLSILREFLLPMLINGQVTIQQ